MGPVRKRRPLTFKDTGLKSTWDATPDRIPYHGYNVIEWYY
jgi:hypothetical protein